MNLQICYYIREIAQQKSLTKAAQNLYITQSALSQQISKLEKEFQAQLFEYKNGLMNLTEAGKILHQNCEQMIAIKEVAYDRMHTLAEDSSEYISLAVDRHIGSMIIAEILPVFKNYYPESKIHIVESDSFAAKQQLLDGKLNIAIMAEKKSSHSIIRQHLLYQEEIYLAVSALHKMAAYYKLNEQIFDHPVDLSLFRDDLFILSKPATYMRKLVDMIFKDNQIIPNISLEINNFNAVQKMVEKNMGIAFIPRSCLTFYPNLLFLPLQPRFYYDITLSYNMESQLTDSVQDLIKLIQVYFQDKRDVS